jgi:hypothetical protein
MEVTASECSPLLSESLLASQRKNPLSSCSHPRPKKAPLFFSLCQFTETIYLYVHVRSMYVLPLPCQVALVADVRRVRPKKQAFQGF